MYYKMNIKSGFLNIKQTQTSQLLWNNSQESAVISAKYSPYIFFSFDWHFKNSIILMGLKRHFWHHFPFPNWQTKLNLIYLQYRSHLFVIHQVSTHVRLTRLTPFLQKFSFSSHRVLTFQIKLGKWEKKVARVGGRGGGMVLIIVTKRHLSERVLNSIVTVQSAIRKMVVVVVVVVGFH